MEEDKVTNNSTNTSNVHELASIEDPFKDDSFNDDLDRFESSNSMPNQTKVWINLFYNCIIFI